MKMRSEDEENWSLDEIKLSFYPTKKACWIKLQQAQSCRKHFSNFLNLLSSADLLFSRSDRTSSARYTTNTFTTFLDTNTSNCFCWLNSIAIHCCPFGVYAGTACCVLKWHLFAGVVYLPTLSEGYFRQFSGRGVEWRLEKPYIPWDRKISPSWGRTVFPTSRIKEKALIVGNKIPIATERILHRRWGNFPLQVIFHFHFFTVCHRGGQEFA